MWKILRNYYDWNGVSERRGEGEGREKSDSILVNVYACEEFEIKYIM